MNRILEFFRSQTIRIGRDAGHALVKVVLEKVMSVFVFFAFISVYHMIFHDDELPWEKVDEPQCIQNSATLDSVQQVVLSTAIPLIKKYDGLRLDTYDDNGVRAVGYGYHLSGDDVHLQSITRKTAECLLNEQVREIVHYLDATLPDAGLNTNEKAALTSWIYNVGISAAKRSHLYEVIQSGELQRVPLELRRWVTVNGKVHQEMEARREDEIRLFNQPVP